MKHFYSLALKTFFAKKNKGLLAWLFFLTSHIAFGQVSGTVFRDFNGDGAKEATEPLISGITVNAYDATNALCGTTVSAGTTEPNYMLTGCGTASVRVEFVLSSSGSCANSTIDFSALGGATYGSSVQFVNGNSANVNFALHNPSDYNQGTTNVSVFIPCYISGDPLVPGDAADGDWFVGYPYTNSGPVGTATGAGTPPSQKVNGAIIGPTWGVVYSKQAQKIFTSALLKRHVGLGTLGSGGIYMLEPTATSFNVTEFYDLDANGHRTRADASAPAYGENSSYSIASNSIITYLGSNDPLTGNPSGLGVIGTNVQRGLTDNPLDPSYDPAMFDQVGKVGIGDIDISDDGKYLFVMNLYSRKVFRLELDNAYNPTSVVSVTSYDVPDPTCTNGSYRPWGFKFFRNKLYVGVICSGENGGAIADLSASVFELNNPTAAATFNTSAVVTLPLNYDKENDPKPWTNNSNIFSTSVEAQRYGTPLLSDIEFTDNGDMVLGFMDRSGHQWGEENRRFLKTNTQSVTISTSGDILVAGLNCSAGTFALENNGTFTSANGSVLTGTSTLSPEGPGGKEFFNDNSVSGDPHRESATGALAVLKGQGDIMSTAFAQNKNSGDAGTMTLSTTNGSFNDYYQLYYRGNPDGIFAKANGLGDIEFSGAEAPIEIGNRLWTDTNQNGIQDADEAGIDGVTVKLFEGATEVGSTTTANGGQYYFTNTNVTGGLKYNTAYEIRIGTAQAPLSTLSLTTTDVGTNGADLIDNDGTISGANAIKTFTTGNSGENDHSFDFGFKLASNCTEPSSITLLQNAPTCNGGTPNNDGKITLTAVTGVDKFGVSTGATYSGTPNYAAATAIGTLPQDLQTAIPNAGATYTIRFFNGADDCFKDSTVVVAGVCCLMVTATTPVCHANGTPEAPADDYFIFSINAVSSLAGSETFTVTAVQNGNPLAVTLSNGSPATAVNCALDAPLRTPDGSAGNGDVTLTITDNNFGCTTTLVVTDPGECGLTCTPGSMQMVMYNYTTQFDVTELENLPIVIPKFDDQGGTRTLISAKLDYEIGVKSVMLHENKAANPQNFRVNSLSDAFIDLNGSTIATASLAITGVQTSVPAGILVPAQGTWLGDSTPPMPQPQVASTLLAMEPWLTEEKLTFFKDPRTDPRWVTNATGNPAHDDDIIYYPPAIDTALGSITYSAPGDLALFIGTGSLPLTATTLSGLQTIGGGGNISTFQRTRAYAAAKVTYTFECLVSCNEPSAITLAQTAPTCSGGTPNNDGKITLAAVTGADKFGISTGATYSGTPNYATATAIGSLPQDLQTAIPNAGEMYTIRFFNGADDCFKDSTVSVASVNCACTAQNNPICPGESYTLTAQAGLTNYQWYSIDGLDTTAIPGETNQAFIATAVGKYIWKALDGNGCEIKLCCPVELILGNCCTIPTAITLTQTAPTCAAGVAQNDGKITLTTVTGADKFGISTGATYSGTPDYAAATAIGAIPKDLYAAVPNTGGTFTIRLYNGANDCFKDTTLTVSAVNCGCLSLDPWMTAQALGGTGGPTSSVASGVGTLGGERDMVLSNLTPSDANGIFATSEPAYFAGYPVLEIANASGRFSKLTITYDGPDGNAATLDTTGLNGVDLLTNGANGFVSTINTDGAPGTGDLPVMFQVFDMNGGASSALINVAPTNNATIPFNAPFSAFAAIGGFSAADFTQVGSIVLMIDMQTRNGWDVLMTDMKLDCCISPSAITMTQTAPSCTSGTPNNDGKITLTAVTSADKFGISTGATYSGTPNYAAATSIGTLPQDLQTAIPNAGETYTIRFFNGADDCFKDSTVTVAAVGCVCTTFDVPELTVAGISFAPGSAPVSENVTLNGGGNVLPENNIAGFYFSTSSEGPFYTLCTQIAQPVLPLQNPYTHELTNTANGFTPAVALRLAQLVEASGFNSTTGFGAGNNTITNFVAMQFAVWNSLYDTDYSLVAGPFQVLTENNPGARTLGDSWLAAAQSIATPSAVVHNLAHQTGQDLLMLGDVPPVTVSVAPPTCTGANSPNNGKMTVIGFTAGQRYQYTSGTIFAGTPIPAAITDIPAGGVIDSTLNNLTSAYTVRVYDINDDNCFTDRTVYLTAVVCCELPTAITLSQTAATCVSGVAQNDGKITLTAVTGADKFGVSTGATYSGTPDYMAATAIGTLPQDLQTAIPNAGETYTIRFFNGADDCFKDSTVTVAAVNCVAPCALTITSVTPSVCNPATNQFSLDVVVTYSNPPTGGLTVSTSGGATSTVAQTGSPQTISFTGLNSDGVQDYAVVAEFVNDSNCKHVLPAAYDAPASCLCDTTLVVRDSTICAGAQVNLFAQTSGVKGVLTYSTDGLVFNPLTDPTLVSPTATATFYVKDSLSAACLDIETLEITVVQPANAGVANNPLAPICMAATGLATIDLFGQLTGEDAGGTWAKTSGPAVGINFDGNAGTLDPNGLTAGTYVFEYTVTGDVPCPNDSETVSVTIQDCTLPCPPKVCLPITVVKVVGGN